MIGRSPPPSNPNSKPATTPTKEGVSTKGTSASSAPSAVSQSESTPLASTSNDQSTFTDQPHLSSSALGGGHSSDASGHQALASRSRGFYKTTPQPAKPQPGTSAADNEGVLFTSEMIDTIKQYYGTEYTAVAPQANFLNANSDVGGACFGASVDWLRRVSIKDSPKTSILHSRKEVATPEESLNRMQKKYSRYSTETEILNKNFNPTPATANFLRDKEGYINEQKKLHTDAANNALGKLAEHKVLQGKEKDISRMKLNCISYHSVAIGGDDMGDHLKSSLGEIANNTTSTSSYMLALKGPDAGHAMAVHQTPDSITIMDPNLGELSFARPKDDNNQTKPGLPSRLNDFIDQALGPGYDKAGLTILSTFSVEKKNG